MREVGITLELNKQATQVLVTDKKATGIRLESGEELHADLVVFDADPPKVYRDLIPEEHRRKWTDNKIKRLSFSMGLFVWYFGTNKAYPDVEHHTIIMGNVCKELLEDIYDRKVLSEDLSLYLHRPSATDPDMAPDGGDAF